MLSGARRHLLVIALLLVAVILTWGQRWIAAANPAPASGEGEPEAAPALPYTYFVDVEGWYRITPYETVVRSACNLSADSSEAMAAALPVTVGDWRQAGPDKYVGDDPGVVFYLGQPTVALQRTYRDGSGRSLTLVLLGNKGEDSFLLFSHTPETCYPGRLWQGLISRRESALLDDQPMSAQYLLSQQAQTGEKLVVLYWYLWDTPRRDPEDGVLSMRVNLFVPPGQSEEAVLAWGWDFIRSLFPQTVPWERF